MVDKFERQKAVAHYLLENPQACPAQISEALCLTDRATRYVIGVMTESGMIIRTRNAIDGRIHNFVVSDWYADELVNGPTPEPTERGQLRQLQATATQLEKRGLWRRAATVWAELSRLQKTVTGVALIASQRNRCVRRARA
ncbi:PerC family transcriptional regulator [Kluyvera georgiana]|uniref:PerC family transcriptional regulator n=1 Tax=Kluyvera georgiana TaxID=73098 RepID=UPI003AF111B2